MDLTDIIVLIIGAWHIGFGGIFAFSLPFLAFDKVPDKKIFRLGMIACPLVIIIVWPIVTVIDNYLKEQP